MILWIEYHSLVNYYSSYYSSSTIDWSKIYTIIGSIWWSSSIRVLNTFHLGECFWIQSYYSTHSTITFRSTSFWFWIPSYFLSSRLLSFLLSIIYHSITVILLFLLLLLLLLLLVFFIFLLSHQLKELEILVAIDSTSIGISGCSEILQYFIHHLVLH